MPRNTLPSVIRLILALSLSISSVSLPALAAGGKFETFSAAAEKAYQAQDYAEAEKNFVQALKESDKLEKGDKRPATTKYNLALVYQAEGKYTEAEDMFSKAKDAFIEIYGADHQRVGQVYLDMADLYVQQAGEDAKPELRKKADESYKNAIAVFEKLYAQATGQAPEGETKPPEDQGKPDDAGKKKDSKPSSGKSSGQEAAQSLASAIKALAGFYSENDEYDKAEPLFKRMLELEDFATGGEDKQLAKDKARFAEFYCVQGKYKLAAPYFKEALDLSEKLTGPDSEDTAAVLYAYGGLHYDEGTFAEAEKMFKRSLKIFDKTNHDENDLAMKSIALADVLDMENKGEEAQGIYKKSISVLEKNPDPSGLLQALRQYQKHLLMQNNKPEAAKVAARIKELKSNASKQAQE